LHRLRRRDHPRREHSLIGVFFVVAAVLLGILVLLAFHIARGTLPSRSPKTEDGGGSSLA
jgi:hypothetical protein